MSNLTICERVALADYRAFRGPSLATEGPTFPIGDLHTVYDSTDDLVYLSIPYPACKPSSKSWSEVAFYRLEGASSCCWSCQCRGSKSSSEAAASEPAVLAGAIEGGDI